MYQASRWRTGPEGRTGTQAVRCAAASGGPHQPATTSNSTIVLLYTKLTMLTLLIGRTWKRKNKVQRTTFRLFHIPTALAPGSVILSTYTDCDFICFWPSPLPFFSTEVRLRINTKSSCSRRNQQPGAVFFFIAATARGLAGQRWRWAKAYNA